MRGHNIAKKKSKEREAQLLSLNPSSKSQQRKHIKMIGKNIGLDPLKYQFLQQAEKNSFTPAAPALAYGNWMCVKPWQVSVQFPASRPVSWYSTRRPEGVSAGNTTERSKLIRFEWFAALP